MGKRRIKWHICRCCGKTVLADDYGWVDHRFYPHESNIANAIFGHLMDHECIDGSVIALGPWAYTCQTCGMTFPRAGDWVRHNLDMPLSEEDHIVVATLGRL